MSWVSAARLRDLARDVLADLPEEFRKGLENVSIVVDDEPGPRDLARRPPGTTLLGIYRGVPRNTRGTRYSLALPDEIVLFRGPIRRNASCPADVKELVRKVLLHEIGHYFGLGEGELRRLGY